MEPAIRTGHDDDGRRIAMLVRERRTLLPMSGGTDEDGAGEARDRIAEIDSELEELGVRRVPAPDGTPHGPEA